MVNLLKPLVSGTARRDTSVATKEELEQYRSGSNILLISKTQLTCYNIITFWFCFIIFSMCLDTVFQLAL
jgi:Fe2+ transport system protein B